MPLSYEVANETNQVRMMLSCSMKLPLTRNVVAISRVSFGKETKLKIYHSYRK